MIAEIRAGLNALICPLSPPLLCSSYPAPVPIATSLSHVWPQKMRFRTHIWLGVGAEL